MSSPVTLVTGSSRGIGRALAEHYVEAGHMVVGCARSGSDLVHDAYRHEIVDVTDHDAGENPFFE